MARINLNNISSILYKLPISQDVRDDILKKYSTELNNYYILSFQTPKINEFKWIQKFSGGYFYKVADEKCFLIAKVYLKNGFVDYGFFLNNVLKLDLIPEEVEAHIIEFIFKPLSIDELDFISSIFTSRDCHFHYLEKKLADNPSGIRFRPYFIIQ